MNYQICFLIWKQYRALIFQSHDQQACKFIGKKHFVNAKSRWKTISLNPHSLNNPNHSINPNRDANLQENRFTSQFSLLRFRINCAQHKHDIIYPKECHTCMSALTNDVISHCIKLVQPPTGFNLNPILTNRIQFNLPHFHSFGTPIWQPLCCVKMLYWTFWPSEPL